MKGVEHAKFDQPMQVWQFGRNTDKADQPLAAEVEQQIDETLTLERFGIAAVKLQQVDGGGS